MAYQPEVRGTVDTANSTQAALGVSGVFTGSWTEITLYDGISVLVDGASAGTAGGTLEMQFSHDGTTVHRNISIAIADVTAAAPRTLGTVARYFRVIYTNGSVAQTALDIQVLLHPGFVRLVSRLDQSVGEDEDVQNVRSFIGGKDEIAGTFKNVSVATSTNLAGTYQSLQVASGARPSQLPGRTAVRIVINHQTAPVLAYTVTASKTLYITDISMTVENSSSGSGSMDIYDDTATPLTGLVLPTTITDPGAGASALTTIEHSYVEPLAFSVGVYLDESAGTLDMSGVILGYEE